MTKDVLGGVIAADNSWKVIREMDEEDMENYFMRDIHVNDYKQVAGIYNSNRSFLLNHLGVESIDEDFISREVLTMSKVGFCSCVIVNRETQMVQGVLDYKTGKEVYLSLLMLDASLQGKGIGHQIYLDFEKKMRQLSNTSIRIDVVNDYCGNVVPFWKNLGFEEGENISLEWGNKKSNAVVMRKELVSE